MTIQEKVFKNTAAALPLIHQWKKEGFKIVFTNGCFDLIHIGHVLYLEDAKSLGDKLIVGLNSDASVSRLKGAHRPIKDEYNRSHILAALQILTLIINSIYYSIFSYSNLTFFISFRTVFLKAEARSSAISKSEGKNSM